MNRRFAFLAVGVAGLALAAAAAGMWPGGGLLANELPPRTAQLFSRAPWAVQDAAAEIERGSVPTPDQLAAIEDLDARYGDDITLFWHALASGNVPAVEALVKAGASMYQRAKTDHGVYFYEIMARPGGALIGPEGIQELVRIYLENGGDPNATWSYPGGNETFRLATTFVTYGNFDGIEALLMAGADPWAEKLVDGEPQGNLMTSLALNATEPKALELLDHLIDAGWFDNPTQKQLSDFMRALSFYSQRGDETSLAIKDIAMRVLKRNPNYKETAPNRVGTHAIFIDHYEDEGFAEIPWDRILSDEIK